MNFGITINLAFKSFAVLATLLAIADTISLELRFLYKPL